MKTWISTLGIAIGCVLGCVPTAAEQDSRTTWLSICGEDSECDSQLSCVCGMCTRVCDDAASCDLGPDAVCRQGTGVIDDCSGTKICTRRCESSDECPVELQCKSGQCVQASGGLGEPSDAAIPGQDARAPVLTEPEPETEADDATDPMSGPTLEAGASPSSAVDELTGQPTDATDDTSEMPDGTSVEPDTTTPGQVDAGVVDATATPDDEDEVGPCDFVVPSLAEVLEPDDCGDECPESLAFCDGVGGDAAVERYFLATMALEHRAESLLDAAQYSIVQSVKAWTGVEELPDVARMQLETLLAEGAPGLVIGPIERAFEEPNCGASASELVAVAAACGPDFDPGQQSASCDGLCTNDASNMAACSGEAELRCDDPLQMCPGACTGACILAAGQRCEGPCDGTCTVESAADCAGTCTAVDDDPSGGCVCDLAPGAKCNGACSGACLVIDAQCDGECAGTCEYVPPEGGCLETILCDGQSECAGTCNGELSARQLEAACTASTHTLLATRQRCVPTASLISITQPDVGYDPLALQTALECFAVADSTARDVRVLADRALDSAQELKASLLIVSARLDESDGAEAQCALGLFPDAAERIDLAVTRLERAIALYY